MDRDRDDARRSGPLNAAGRLAFIPARAVARASREQIAAAAEHALAAPEVAAIVDQLLAGPLPEHVAQSLVEHRVLDRVVAQLAASGELDRLLAAALASPRATEVTDQLLSSEPFQLALEGILSSPAFRTAVSRQTTGFAEETAAGLRGWTRRLDDGAERLVGRKPDPVRSTFGGIASRGLALAIDAGLVALIAATIGAFASLIASLVGQLRPSWLAGTLVGAGAALVCVAYFTLFWTAAGRTPGMQLMHLRVCDRSGGSPSAVRSLVRVFGLALSITFVFLGFVPALFDRRRRALPDFLAGTVVAQDDL